LSAFVTWFGSLFGAGGGVIDSAGLTFALRSLGYQGREPSTFKRPESPAWAQPNFGPLARVRR
jgi:hypothetical protein